MGVTITFLGAAGTVTGSKYLVESSSAGKKTVRLLIDAGMFQGAREWRERNWIDLPEKLLSEIDACLLTHAHVDHVGILPRLVQQGLRCPVYATAASCDLARVILEDAAMLQEEDAEFRAKKGDSRHLPPQPLFTAQGAAAALKLFRAVAFDERQTVLPGVSAVWRHAGHILGAASISLEIGGKRLTFSGDVGRYGVPIMRDPEPWQPGDLLLVESTYGNREHSVEDPKRVLGDLICRVAARQGTLVIPSFAVGRAQLMLFYLRELKEQKRIPDIPIVVDSPTAIDATDIYRRYPQDYDEESLQLFQGGRRPFGPTKLFFCQSRADSIKLNDTPGPMIIVAASGMLSGGRVLHHLRHRLPDERNAVALVGYQPPGSRGFMLKSGAETLRIFHEDVPIRAEILDIGSCSAHAGRSELLRWCKSAGGKPAQTAVVHGEPEAAAAFEQSLRQELGFECFVAQYQSSYQL